MVDRKPNLIATGIVATIYWGMLYYWLRDEFVGTAEEQMHALRMFLVSIPYVAFVMWSAMSDLPENFKSIPYVGRALKPGIWLISVIGLAYWGWVDTSAVGFLLVGVALLGLAVSMALVCLLYSGSESSRLYGLSRFVDVYPSITKPEGHVRFNQKLWTTTLVLIIYFMTVSYTHLTLPTIYSV